MRNRMGASIESYSLAELKKISIPGKVVPSLFWLVPIGNWKSNNLEKLWRLFTETDSKCNEFGLMLNKNDYRFERDDEEGIYQKSGLSKLTGELEDLIPGGYSNKNTFLRDENKNGVLILSGSYPQPGWGVLVSFNEPNEFEYILKKTLSRINPKYSTIFKIASSKFELLLKKLIIQLALNY